jgi:hypothetical protein
MGRRNENRSLSLISALRVNSGTSWRLQECECKGKNKNREKPDQKFFKYRDRTRFGLRRGWGRLTCRLN